MPVASEIAAAGPFLAVVLGALERVFANSAPSLEMLVVAIRRAERLVITVSRKRQLGSAALVTTADASRRCRQAGSFSRVGWHSVLRCW
jgi:hypothetical protein